MTFPGIKIQPMLVFNSGSFRWKVQTAAKYKRVPSKSCHWQLSTDSFCKYTHSRWFQSPESLNCALICCISKWHFYAAASFLVTGSMEPRIISTINYFNWPATWLIKLVCYLLRKPYLGHPSWFCDYKYAGLFLAFTFNVWL